MSEHDQNTDVIQWGDDVFEELEASRIQGSQDEFERRFVLTAGQTHTHVTPDGLTEYVAFDAVRITGLSARVQEIESGKALSVNFNLVLDGFEAGTVDDSGDLTPHEFFTNPRYAMFRDNNERFPKRIPGSAWVQEENKPKFIALVNALGATKRFTILKNPKNAPNSERSTRDRVRLIPHNASATRLGQPDYGYKLDGFEMQVNVNYERGHRSFTQGLDEQCRRIDSVESMGNVELQRSSRAELARNVSYVTGAVPDKQGRERPRQLDIGKLFFGGQEFALYEPGGAMVSAGLFDDVVTSGKAISAKTTGVTESGAELSADDLEEPELEY